MHASKYWRALADTPTQMQGPLRALQAQLGEFTQIRALAFRLIHKVAGFARGSS